MSYACFIPCLNFSVSVGVQIPEWQWEYAAGVYKNIFILVYLNWSPYVNPILKPLCRMN